MIGKLIRMNRRQRRAALRRLQESLFALTRYIMDADPYRLIVDTDRAIVSLTDYAIAVAEAGVEPGEKVEASGVRNLFGSDLAQRQAEMLAVAAQAPSMKSPVIHIILSLQEQESWTEEQREEAITIILQTLGLERCQVIWAQHSNTSNAHLHLSIVRVDPLTFKKAGSDWLIDDLHQALALVEERQGRACEPGALYVARQGAVFDADTNIMVRDAGGGYITGWYKQLERKHDRLPPTMRPQRASMMAAAEQARSWPELHLAFEEIGATYDRSGSGARISFEGVSATASEVHSTLSRTQLEERLGPFEPDLSRLNPNYEAYRHAFERQLKDLRLMRNEERQRLADWMSATIATLPPGAATIVTRSIKAEAKAADKSIADAFKLAITRCTKHRMTEEAWKEAGEPKAPPPIISPCLLLPAVVDGAEREWKASNHLDRKETDWATEYRLDGTPLFTDHRIAIVVHAADRSDGIDEALRIAAARWGSVTARGPEAYLRLVAERAAVLRIEVLDASGSPLTAAKEVEEQPELPTSAPAPNAAQWEKPDLADDLVREMRIDRAIRELQNFAGLLLRRREMPGDTKESGRSGPLEIVLNDDPTDGRNKRLAEHAMFDDNPRVQEFLQRKRQEALDDWSRSLLSSPLDPSSMSARDMVNSLPSRYEVRRPAFLALEDSDCIAMLQHVRERMLLRAEAEPERRSATTVRASDLNRDREPLHAEAQSQAGYSAEDLMAWQAAQMERDE
ncbi:MAG: relaxase/mobilization nuclease domain-containing protein [Allosphingosinicella sp.]|uniref:relaxase/mobilization nuclease domain-containing protein n=1 Tax=Allosphingosinicella sp. TaxID=2823234 RepID=UPI0039242D07